MLALEPAYLPLQPLSWSAPLHGSTSSPLGVRAAATGSAVGDEASSCSIASLRSAFRPFPIRTSTDAPAKGDPPAKRVKRQLRRPDAIRPIRRADVDAVRKLQNTCLPLEYPISFYTTLMSSSTSACLASFDTDDTPTGFVAVQLIAPPPAVSPPRRDPAVTLYVLALSVSAGSRRQGHAKRLLREAIADLARKDSQAGRLKVKLSLHVEVGNEAAQAFYRTLGLAIVGTRPNFYRRLRSDGRAADAYEMEGLVDSL